jgi:AcrR family transcriptional regulator
VIDAYHHGDLRRAVLERAVQVIGSEGADALSLRALAADLGVSHTAPRHHFASRQGLLTAIAVDGFVELRARLEQARDRGGSFLDVGVGYVEFALDRPAHFSVMFTPAILDPADPELEAAMEATFALLRQGVDALPTPSSRQDAAAAVIASWSLVHGLATLALTGNLDKARVRDLVGGDLLDLARRSAAMLHQPTDPRSAAEKENP